MTHKEKLDEQTLFFSFVVIVFLSNVVNFAVHVDGQAEITIWIVFALLTELGSSSLNFLSLCFIDHLLFLLSNTQSFSIHLDGKSKVSIWVLFLCFLDT